MDAMRDVPASRTVPDATLRLFESSIRGELLRPGDARYEAARQVWNGMIDRRPAFVVRCRDAADVGAAVGFARDHGLPLAVRGGGHNVAGHAVCDGGVVADLSPMKGIRVDAKARSVRAEGGCTWGDLDHATHAYGLAAPGGMISTTGIAGLTLGGGIGHLTRRYGLAADNLLSADLVLADGRLVTAGADCNPDLYWAIRGGGGNFGVVTSFEFRLHPVATVLAGPVLYPLEKAREALRHYRDFVDDAPDDVSAFFAFLVVPPGPPFPAPLHNRTVCGVCVCCTAPPAQAAKLVAPLRRFGPPLLDLVGTVPFPALQSMFDPLVPAGLQSYWRAEFADELTDAVIEAHLKHGPSVPTPNSAVHIYPTGGAAGRVGKHETAYFFRDARYVQLVAAIYSDPTETAARVRWVRDYWQALRARSSGGGYVNFMMDEGDERVRATFGGNYPRLTQVKARYDPRNLFRLNQNVAPRA